ncbi:hypothetical protein [Cohnella caldifontis]|uniref:hypothetical protein n=1 Tax=Cohnella caldifontis TaxID=3027471 RepID=UPI0023ED7501|nr:hypothetical protein [Cohnella sp. YIM B05605]
MIRGELSCRVAHECSNGRDALARLESHSADLVLSDVKVCAAAQGPRFHRSAGSRRRAGSA